MPGKVKVKIVAGRNLPVMDRSNDTTDAYVEVKLGQITHKTDVCRKSLNPQWNSEWFRFEMDDLELQDEPLQIRLMDHDTYSANDAIGKVYLDLNPLLINTSKGKDSSGRIISGWIPVFDTMHGIRGEVNLMVKVELFSDLNKFRQSSCGVRFFFTQGVPEGYVAHAIQGFVEELVVNDDPEYQWIDKIRTPRASNEARQTLFSKLSGEVQRRVGLKALELGGNAVIGYKQCFDLEGESGIVVRGIGTAIFLTKLFDNQLSPTCGLIDPTGANRESMETHPVSKSRNQLSSRSLKKLRGPAGSPSRTPRLKRSFRAPSSTFTNASSIAEAVIPSTLLLRRQLHHVVSDDLDDEFLTISHNPLARPLGDGVSGTSSSGGGGHGARTVGNMGKSLVKETKSSSREESSQKFLRSRAGCSSKGTSSSSRAPMPSSSDSSIIPGLIRRTTNDKLKVILPKPVEPNIARVERERQGEHEISDPTSPHSAPVASQADLLQSLCQNNKQPFPNTFLIESPVLRRNNNINNINNNNNNNNSSDEIAEPSSADTNRARNSNSMSSSDSPKLGFRSRNKSRGYLNEKLVLNDKDEDDHNTEGDILRFVGQSVDCNLVGESILDIESNLEELEDSTSDNSHMQSGSDPWGNSSSSKAPLVINTDSDTGAQSPLPCRGSKSKAVLPTSSETKSPLKNYFQNFQIEQSQRRKSVNSEGAVSPTTSKKERFALLRKRRGSRKKDKFSTTCLIKRASEIFEDKEPGPSGTERIKEELSKLLKRITTGETTTAVGGEGDSSSEKSSRSGGKYTKKAMKEASKSSSPYREPARFFFRNRRRTASGDSRRERNPSNLTRSTSESRSLWQTSLESLQSVESEPVFDLEDEDDELSDTNCSSLIEIPTYSRSTVQPGEVEYRSKEGEGVGEVISGCGLNPRDSRCGPHVEQGVPVTMSKTQLRKLIKELGYDTTKSLKLYISSMDALLVYEPTLERNQRSSPPLASALTTAKAKKSGKPELMNVLSGACGRGNFSGTGTGDWNVVNLDSDSDLESFMHLSRTSTGSSSLDTRTRPLHHSRLRRHTETHEDEGCKHFPTDNDDNDPLHYLLQEGGTETSLSSQNTDSSQSSFANYSHKYGYKDDRNSKTQPQKIKRHYYHNHQHQQSSREDRHRQGLAEFVRRNNNTGGIVGEFSGGLDLLTDEGDLSSLRDNYCTTVTTTTTDDEENAYDMWTTPSSTFRGKDSDDIGININDGMSVLHDFGIMTGCRSPIPEELSETPVNAVSWINKAISATSGPGPTGHSSSSPPPSSTNSNNNIVAQPPIPNYSSLLRQSHNLTGSAVTNANNGKKVANGVHHHGLNNLNDGIKIPHREDRDSSSTRSGSDSPEKITPGAIVGGVVPVTSVPARMQHNNQHVSSSSSNNGSGNVNNINIINNNNNGNTNAHGSIIPLNRRSSESDLSTPPKGNSTFGAHISTRNQAPRTGINFENLEMLEFPFITISQFPLGFIFYLGGTVTARSVKLLERVSNLDEPETRDAWWNELRMEIRSHCRAFGGTVVLGYEEHTTMCDDVCILSASGTAAVVVSGNLTTVDHLSVNSKAGGVGDILKERAGSGRTESFNSHPNVRQSYRMTKLLSANRRLIEFADEDVMVQGLKSLKAVAPNKSRHDSDGCPDPNCAMLHIPHNGTPMPVSVRMTRCAFCKKGKVPDVLLATIEIPSGLHITGRSCLIQAQVFRPKKDVKGETSAKEVSDSLPFLEYELHRRLINKLKVKGMNAIFGLQVQICLGDKLMVAIATGTAVFLTSLPAPNVPIISAGNLKTDSQKVVQFQKVVQEAFDKNRDMFCVRNIVIPQTQNSSTSSDGDDSEDELQDELGHRNKDTYVLEVDDAEDIDIISMLIDPSPPVGYNMNNVETLLGFDDHKVLNQQMFSQIWRCRIPTLSLRQFTAYFDRLIRSVSFKLRRMQPCVLTKLSFNVELPEQDEMQLSIIGMAVGIDNKNSLPSLYETSKTQASGKGSAIGKIEDTEMIFPLEFDPAASSYPLCANDISSTSTSRQMTTITNRVTMSLTQTPNPNPGDITNPLSLTTCSLTGSQVPPPVAAISAVPAPSMTSTTAVKAPSPSSTPSVTVGSSSSTSTTGGGTSNSGVLVPSSNTNVSSSCISVSSSSSSSSKNNTNTHNASESNVNINDNLPLVVNNNDYHNTENNGSSQSDGLYSSKISGIPPQTLQIASTMTNSGGSQSQAINSYSVRHPSSRSAKFLTYMGSHKLIPSPASGIRYWVEITPLSYIHGGRIEKYLGNLNFFFIRETTSIRENGGLSGFVHNFITEVLAIVRAHVAALGGNAMVSYFMTECSLLHNPHKNQGQCVVNVGGDAVFVSYPGGSHPEDGHYS